MPDSVAHAATHPTGPGAPLASPEQLQAYLVRLGSLFSSPDALQTDHPDLAHVRADFDQYRQAMQHPMLRTNGTLIVDFLNKGMVVFPNQPELYLFIAECFSKRATPTSRSTTSIAPSFSRRRCRTSIVGRPRRRGTVRRSKPRPHCRPCCPTIPRARPLPGSPACECCRETTRARSNLSRPASTHRAWPRA